VGKLQLASRFSRWGRKKPAKGVMDANQTTKKKKDKIKGKVKLPSPTSQKEKNRGRKKPRRMIGHLPQ